MVATTRPDPREWLRATASTWPWLRPTYSRRPSSSRPSPPVSSAPCRSMVLVSPVRGSIRKSSPVLDWTEISWCRDSTMPLRLKPGWKEMSPVSGSVVDGRRGRQLRAVAVAGGRPERDHRELLVGAVGGEHGVVGHHHVVEEPGVADGELVRRDHPARVGVLGTDLPGRAADHPEQVTTPVVVQPRRDPARGAGGEDPTGAGADVGAVDRTVGERARVEVSAVGGDPLGLPTVRQGDRVRQSVVAVLGSDRRRLQSGERQEGGDKLRNPSEMSRAAPRLRRPEVGAGPAGTIIVCRPRGRRQQPLLTVGGYQPRSRHSSRCGRSTPSVESLPWPG